MIIGRDLISELKLVLDSDTQCITWDGIDQPVKSQGELQKENTLYEDLYSALISPDSTIFQDDYDANCEPEHSYASYKRQTQLWDTNYKMADLSEIIKCISTIDDIEKHNLLVLLRKYEHLFDGTLVNFETSEVKVNLKEDAKPYHAKDFPVQKIHHDTLKLEIERLVKLGVLKRWSDSEWAAPTLIIPEKNGTVRFISEFRRLNEMLKIMHYPIPENAQMLQELEKFAYATYLYLNKEKHA
jgi:hypothetical protein